MKKIRKQITFKIGGYSVSRMRDIELLQYSHEQIFRDRAAIFEPPDRYELSVKMKEVSGIAFDDGTYGVKMVVSVYGTPPQIKEWEDRMRNKLRLTLPVKHGRGI